MPPRKAAEEERDSRLEVEPAEVSATESAAEVAAAEVAPAAAEVPATEVTPAIAVIATGGIHALVVTGVEALIEP